MPACMQRLVDCARYRFQTGDQHVSGRQVNNPHLDKQTSGRLLWCSDRTKRARVVARTRSPEPRNRCPGLG